MSGKNDGLNTLTQDQMILARSRLWTPELDKLLRRWKKQLGKREKGHLDLARKYNRRHYIFGIPATVLSALIATGILATFENCDSCDDGSAPECEADQWIRLAIGILGLLSAGLTAFQTFMNYQQESEKHKSAADDYGSMFRVIDTMLLVPGPVRGDPVSTLQNLRSQYDDLVRRSPTLPKKYDAELTYEVIRPDKIRLPTPPRPDDIRLSSRTHSRLLEKTTGDLRRLMTNSKDELDSESEDTESKPKAPRKHSYSDDESATGSALEALDHVFAVENDHDTSDEEHEVCIAFDLDSAGCYNTTTAALAAARLAAQRDEQIQTSLQRALNFELRRLEEHSRTPPEPKPKAKAKAKKSKSPKAKAKKSKSSKSKRKPKPEAPPEVTPEVSPPEVSEAEAEGECEGHSPEVEDEHRKAESREAEDDLPPPPERDIESDTPPPEDESHSADVIVRIEEEETSSS